MGNSPHSIGFFRLFDSVVASVSQPLHERLWETRQAGDNPDPGRQLALDLLNLTTALHVKKGELTFRQYAFLGDLYDHALSRPGTVAEFTAQVNKMAEAESEPPTTSLNLLRGYDALRKTSIASMYKDLLLKIVTVSLTHIEKPPSTRDKQIIEEFDLFWTEVVTATRTPQKCFYKESISLTADLNKAVVEFVFPAREVINAYEQLTQMEGLQDTEGFIRRSFRNYCAQAVLADSVVDQRELELFHDLAPTLMFFGSQGSVENLQAIFQSASKNIDPAEKPLLVSILDVYDDSMKTDLAARARSLYFRLANSAFKADLTVNEEELEWLRQFKETLYPDGTAEGFENQQSNGLDAESADKQIVGEVPVEKSLEELNSLIGLERVKQDLAQLVNFIKVQQMRVEKGMPGSPIPRAFSFHGNPGTGKIGVARILANIYRALKIIDKGHVVEVDRADLFAGESRPTAAKIQEMVASGIGGVLFIDDAYALVQEAGQSHGQEAVDALVKAIEQNENLVVILAGNPEKMERLLNANSGLKSRFNKVFHFEDYTPDQMLKLYEASCARAAFQTSASALELVKSLFDQLYSGRGEGYGNARDVRRIFESIIGNQANRIISLPQVNEEILSTITDEDVRPVVASIEKADAKQTLQR